MVAPSPHSSPDGAATISVKNPATGAEIGTVPIETPAAVHAKMERVRAAAQRWAAVSVEARCEKIARAAAIAGARVDALAESLSAENGKPRVEAAFLDVGSGLAVMNYFAKNGPRILKPKPLRLAIARHRRSYLAYQPRGVVGVITPWNFPFFMPASDVSMSLVAGNGVLLKPSERTPLSALALKACLDEAGIDPDLVQVVTGLGETGQALIDARPDHVIFTGSVAVGRAVGVACAERMLSYTLELGGKAPAVVLEDARIDRTVRALLWGGFANAGQICASIERVYVVGDGYERIVGAVAEAASALRVGDASAGDVDLGALTMPTHAAHLEALVDDAKAKGARVLSGGHRQPGAGAFFLPTVLADCTHDMRVMREESFGPLLPFMRVADEAEAVRLSNDSALGLGGYVFGADTVRARAVAEQLEVGSVMVNDVLSHAGMPDMPWGGIKSSGFGFVRSDDGLRGLCHARHVNYDLMPALAADPYWFPYSPARARRVIASVRGMFGPGVVGRVVRGLMH